MCEGAVMTDLMAPLRILCVDDNHDVADSTADLLRITGYDARACYSGLDALDEAESFRPAVCLIDLNMPGMDGDEVARKLRVKFAGIPVVMVAITAMSNEKSEKRIRDAGFDLHLVKPVDPRRLIGMVDSIWRKWASRCPTE